MRKGILSLAMVILSLALATPALAQAQAKPKAEPAKAEAKAETAKAPAVDRDKAYVLQQEFVAATAELRGKLMAKQAELEVLLATKPDEADTIKAAVAEISALRATLFERTVELRLRLAKEAGLPMRASRQIGAPHPGPGPANGPHRRGPAAGMGMMAPDADTPAVAPAPAAKKP